MITEFIPSISVSRSIENPLPYPLHSIATNDFSTSSISPGRSNGGWNRSAARAESESGSGELLPLRLLPLKLRAERVKAAMEISMAAQVSQFDDLAGRELDGVKLSGLDAPSGLGTFSLVNSLKISLLKVGQGQKLFLNYRLGNSRQID